MHTGRVIYLTDYEESFPIAGHDWKPISCDDFGQREERSVDDGATHRVDSSPRSTAGVICSRVFM